MSGFKAPVKHQWRYILSGGVKPTDILADFRLYPANRIDHASEAIRVPVDDVELEQVQGNSYARTRDTRTLNQIGYDVLVRVNWKLQVKDALRPKDGASPILPDRLMRSKGYALAIRDRRYAAQTSWLDPAHMEAYKAGLKTKPSPDIQIFRPGI